MVAFFSSNFGILRKITRKNVKLAQGPAFHLALNLCWGELVWQTLMYLMTIHNGADEVMMICIDNHQQHCEAPIRVYAENTGANHAQAKVAQGAPSSRQ